MTNICIASDHAGFELKTQITDYLKSLNLTIEDLGTNSEESVDYPDYANKVIENIESGKFDLAIAICGTGIGISIALNRSKSVRAALCHNEITAKYSRLHNDANVLVMGSRIVNITEAKNCINEFLNTEFEGGRHLKRINKLG